jgi:ABC-type bacteriocin/lantibiotic exporter with double-glycine peptidase domain
VRADRALKAMCLAELGTHRPVLDHGVEEGGRNLSGGQRQRLVLARALYHRPDFLILDEATSALDPELEKSVFNTLMAELPDAAIVFITHRLSLAMTAETISMLEHGRMVYSGARHPAGAVSERFTQYIQSNQP